MPSSSITVFRSAKWNFQTIEPALSEKPWSPFPPQWSPLRSPPPLRIAKTLRGMRNMLRVTRVMSVEMVKRAEALVITTARERTLVDLSGGMFYFACPLILCSLINKVEIK